jgi:hypothetical protein
MYNDDEAWLKHKYVGAWDFSQGFRTPGHYLGKSECAIGIPGTSKTFNIAFLKIRLFISDFLDLWLQEG